MNTIQKITCCECKEEKDLPFSPQEVAYHVSVGRCFDCDFWHKLWVLRDDLNMVRINGKHYFIGNEYKSAGSAYDNDRMKGFGGEKFRIRFFDGRVVNTTNLWTQGEIDALWRERLPDNAEFLKEEN